MGISGVSDLEAQQLRHILVRSSQQTQSTTHNGIQITGDSSELSVDLSDPGKLFSQLKQLSEIDPEKFRTVMTNIAEEIDNAAESSSDSGESDMLSSVAEDLRKAAESGELPDAVLPPGPPPQGAPPPGPPPAFTSGGATAEQISAYTQNDNAGVDGLQTLLNIIGAALDELE